MIRFRNMVSAVGALLLLAGSVSAGATGDIPRLAPVPGAPKLASADWKPYDQFSKKVVEDGETLLVTDVPAGQAKGAHWFSAVIDLKPYRNRTVTFYVRYRATGLSTPPKPYLGFKFMLCYRPRPDAPQLWPGSQAVPGDTAGWADAAFSVSFGPDVDSGELSLGMQDIHGKVVFLLDSLQVGTVFNPDQRINLDYKVKYPEAVWNHRRQRGVMAPGGQITEEMLRTLQGWNANLMRAQIVRNWGKIGSETDLTEYNQWLDRRLDEIEVSAKLAEKYGIKFVIDLHSPPGGKISAGNMRMFFEKKYADAFVDCWRKIAAKFKGNSSIYAYDLVNEPVQAIPAPFDYWNLQRMAAEAVREIDPDTPIMIESNESDRPQTYCYLSPLAMDNIIYKVHMYFPLSYTHQRLRGEGVASTYPGRIEGEEWNKEKIRATLQPVRDFQLRHNAKIYVGEFSAIVWAPGAERYISDCIEVFEEYGWDWTFHAFREWSGWSVEHDGTNPDDLKPAPNTPRKQALLKGLEKNEKAR